MEGRWCLNTLGTVTTCIVNGDGLYLVIGRKRVSG